MQNNNTSIPSDVKSIPLEQWKIILINPVQKLVYGNTKKVIVDKHSHFLFQSQFSVLDLSPSIQKKFWQDFMGENQPGLNLINDDNLLKYLNRLIKTLTFNSPAKFLSNSISFKCHLETVREQTLFSSSFCFTIDEKIDTKKKSNPLWGQILLEEIIKEEFRSLEKDLLKGKNYFFSVTGQDFLNFVISNKEKRNLSSSIESKSATKIKIF